jgi:hypothetical protein
MTLDCSLPSIWDEQVEDRVKAAHQEDRYAKSLTT